MGGLVIELSTVIQELRTELNTAIAGGAGEELRFELGPIELEVSVAITKEGGGGAKVRFWVVDADAHGKVAGATTQRIKLQLEPKLAATGSRPEVSGHAVSGER
ncbi:hypothetical protein OHB53_11580 [Streptomyces sp. NBC_00056]|uniref:trypco2 family protein n=1 Tax=unclassified Streptomyces TaxID=2593676 RepID=UPI0022510903|nr:MULTISPECIES: trypco2 family protein [unclassified Streptomyces]MCX5440913.1 hypothetical protein [Streptomyces sp. NBC_00063]WUB92732.1 hypothetical protein OHO83_10715 [Streptomyces sp. NBC_00569]